MNKVILAVLTSMIVSCGGAGDSVQPPSVSHEPLRAKISAPNPTLIAQPVSLVNTTTAGNQVLRGIAGTSDGGYTVSWISGTNTLYIQRYDSLGEKEGTQTLIPLVVNDAVMQAVQFSSVSVLDDGRVVITYRAISNTTLPPGTVSTRQGLYFQIFDARGAQLVGETEVAAIEEVIHSRSPSLTDHQTVSLAGGGFVVGWNVRTFSSQFGYEGTQFLQRYDSQGQPIGDVIPVGRFPGLTYRMEADAHGGFTLYLTQYDTSYNRLSSVAHYGANSKTHQIVTPMSGVALLLPLLDGYVLFASDATGAMQRMLDSAGNPVGPAMPMEAMPVDAQELSDGSYVVFWASGAAFTAQRFSANGTPMGDPLAVQGDGTVPHVAALADGGFALAWTAPGAEGDTDVYTQRFIEMPGNMRKACLDSAKGQGLKGQERKAFMTTCLG